LAFLLALDMQLLAASPCDSKNRGADLKNCEY